MKIFLINIFFISQIFAIGGIGLHGNYSMFSHPASVETDAITTTNFGNFTFTSTSKDFSNAIGGGFFIYTDLLPYIDLEYSLELAGQKRSVNINAASDDYELSQGNEFDAGWGRISHYFTIKYNIIGVGIPFLAKAGINCGIGANKHNVFKPLSTGLIMDALDDPNRFSNFDPSDPSTLSLNSKELTTVATYLWENTDNLSGFHLQGGFHAKVLILNLFINARYTIAKNVIKGANGFPSAWISLAYGF